MLSLQPEETLLTGNWISEGSKVRADDVGKRIEWLISGQLEKIKSDGWATLYKDQTDARFWECIYPQSDLHGGGPPTLKCLSEQEAKNKYHA